MCICYVSPYLQNMTSITSNKKTPSIFHSQALMTKASSLIYGGGGGGGGGSVVLF